MTRATHRSAEEIGRTEVGPRPLPPLGEPRTGVPPVGVDTVLPNGLRVIAARHGQVPMVEMRLRIPFAGDDALHPATAEVLAETLLTGTERRDRVKMDTDLAAVGGDLHAVVDPERLSIAGDALASGLDTLLDVLADALTGAYAFTFVPAGSYSIVLDDNPLPTDLTPTPPAGWIPVRTSAFSICCRSSR